MDSNSNAYTIPSARRITRSMTVSTRIPLSSTPNVSHGHHRSSPHKRIKLHSGKKPIIKQSCHPLPHPSALSFGLIQESIAHNLYFLVVQAILWNQTSGTQARPVFNQFISRYPTPAALLQADIQSLTAMLQPLGLQNIRAKRFMDLAKRWHDQPPQVGQTYRRKGYPIPVVASAIAKGATTAAENVQSEWEIAHLPGVGPYALDSFRIFHRDEMRGLAEDWLGNGAKEENFEPEWKRVVPLDKELKAYVNWRWLKEIEDEKEEGDMKDETLI